MSDETNKDIAQEMAELREAMQKLSPAPEPGDFQKGGWVHEGTEEVPMPIRVSDQLSAGYVYIWDTRTGDRSLTNRQMLTLQLSKRREDGSQVFTMADPKIPQIIGEFKCMLHKDDPNRADYDRRKLPICNRENLASLQDVKDHMKHRHRREWASIEEERLRLKEEAKEEREREFQKEMIAAALGGKNKKGD